MTRLAKEICYIPSIPLPAQEIAAMSSAKPTVLLTGVTGRLGARLRELLRTEMALVGISRHQTEDNSIVRLADPSDFNVLDRVWCEIKPDFCIHAAAIADPDECEQDRRAAADANIRYTEAICRSAARWKTKVLFTSTDYVFDGTRSIYEELAPTNPVQFYGETKVAAEALVAKLPDSVVLRLPLLYASGGNTRSNFVGRVFHALEQNRPIYECAERIRYPLFVDDLASVIRFLLGRGHGGIYHISGPTGTTRWAWAKLVAELAGLDPSLVRPREGPHNETGACRPGDIKLDDTKLIQILNPRITSLRQGTEQVLAAYRRATKM